MYLGAGGLLQPVQAALAVRLGYFNEWLGEAAFSSANLKRESPDRENRLPGRGFRFCFWEKEGIL